MNKKRSILIVLGTFLGVFLNRNNAWGIDYYWISEFNSYDFVLPVLAFSLMLALFNLWVKELLGKKHVLTPFFQYIYKLLKI